MLGDWVGEHYIVQLLIVVHDADGNDLGGVPQVVRVLVVEIMCPEAFHGAALYTQESADTLSR